MEILKAEISLSDFGKPGPPLDTCPGAGPECVVTFPVQVEKALRLQGLRRDEQVGSDQAAVTQP